MGSRLILFLSFLLFLGFSASCRPTDKQVTPSEPPGTFIPASAQPLTVTETPSGPERPTTIASESLPESGSPPENLPDLLEIVYLKERNIWLWTPAGRTQLTSSTDVYDLRLSPDGALVVFTRRVGDYQAELWLSETRGGEARRLVGADAFDAIAEGVRDANTVAVNPYQFEWVPGSHRVAFNSVQFFEGPGFSLLNDLQIVDADSFERWTLLNPGSGGEFNYSPDGSQVAIVTPTEINLMDANAGNWRLVLPYEQVATYSEYRYYAQPVWSPDSKFLRLALPPTDPLDEGLPTELWILPADGNAAEKVGELWPLPFFDTPVAYSPNLESLIYLIQSGAPADNRRELRIARADGSQEQAYREEHLLRFLGWGLDSSHFVTLSAEENLAQIGGVDGRNSALPGDPTGGYSVHWIDERLYVFVKEGVDGFEIHLQSLDGGTMLLDVVTAPPPKIDSSTR